MFTRTSSVSCIHVVLDPVTLLPTYVYNNKRAVLARMHCARWCERVTVEFFPPKLDAARVRVHVTVEFFPPKHDAARGWVSFKAKPQPQLFTSAQTTAATITARKALTPAYMYIPQTAHRPSRSAEGRRLRIYNRGGPHTTASLLQPFKVR